MQNLEHLLCFLKMCSLSIGTGFRIWCYCGVGLELYNLDVNKKKSCFKINYDCICIDKF